MSGTCIECGDSFIGRLDKKFCGDQCRSAYNNRLNSDLSQYVRSINKILRKNRRILKSLNPSGKKTVGRDTLIREGFRFEYFTNQYVTKTGNIYKFCYDQGYIELNGHYITLVQRQEYVV